MAIKHDSVADSWSTIVLNGAGQDKWLMDTVEEMVRNAQMQGVTTGQTEISSGIFGERRKVLVVNYTRLRDYRLYVYARDFGTNLDVSWYLTINPGGLKRMM